MIIHYKIIKIKKKQKKVVSIVFLIQKRIVNMFMLKMSQMKKMMKWEK